MALFQSILTLLLLSVLLLQASRRLHIPYPTMLAVAGLLVAALPWASALTFDPGLALALFIAPAILNSAFDFPLRAIRTYWLSLLTLAVVAVLVTTAVVAWAGVALAGLPLAAAVVLGAIVSPPDAAAAAAMLSRPDIPRSTVTVLKGESLLNDAVALLIFGVALEVATDGGPVSHALPRLALAVPGGLLLGFVTGRIAGILIRFLVGTLGCILFQFLFTFTTWMLAERLGVSPILAVVAAAMTAAQRDSPMSALDRIHSNAVWVVVVFVLNVMAFLFVGLEARGIVRSLPPEQLRHDLRFAGRRRQSYGRSGDEGVVGILDQTVDGSAADRCACGWRGLLGDRCKLQGKAKGKQDDDKACAKRHINSLGVRMAVFRRHQPRRDCRHKG